MKTTNYNGYIIIDDGKEIVFECNGKYLTLDACDEFCPRYSSCATVAEVNDVLVDYETGGLGYE